MKAIVVTDQAAGTAGVKLVQRPEPQAAINDVVVQIHASGFTGDELTWPSTWTDRVGRDRTPSIPGHELAGVVTALGYGTTGLSIGQRVFGLTASESGSGESGWKRNLRRVQANEQQRGPTELSLCSRRSSYGNSNTIDP